MESGKKGVMHQLFRIRKLAGYLAAPIAVAWALGVFLGIEAGSLDQTALEQERIEALGQLNRGVLESVESSIDGFVRQLWEQKESRNLQAADQSQTIQASPGAIHAMGAASANSPVVTVNSPGAIHAMGASGAFQQSPSRAQPAMGAILHYAEFQQDAQGVPVLKASVASETLSRRAPGFDSFYLPEVRSALTANPLKPYETAIISVRPDPQQPREWLAIAASGNEKGEIVVGLVDPSEFFGSFSKFAARSLNGSTRAYIVGSRGVVLAHSMPELGGSDFSELSLFKTGIADAISGKRVSGSGHFSGIDHSDLDAAYARVGKLPLAVVVEKLPAERAALMLDTGMLQRLAGMMMASFGAILFMLAIFGTRLWNWIEAQAKNVVSVSEAFAQAAVVHAEPLLTKTAEAVSPAAVAAATAKAQAEPAPQHAAIQGPAAPVGAQTKDEPMVRVANRTLEGALQAFSNRSAPREQQAQDMATYELQRALQEHAMIDRFEAEAVRLKSPKQVAERLTETAAVLCKSPTLFFTYFEGNFSGVLQADAGFPAGTQLPRLSFSIDPKVLNAISNPSQTGDNPSLSDYEPLSKLILSRFGIAHFDSWAVTGFGPLGRVAGKPRLLGVLVVLKAGTESANRREVLSRMMRCTGLVYENAVLSL